LQAIHVWPSLWTLLVRCSGMGGKRRGTLHYQRAPQRWVLSPWSSSSGATPSALASLRRVFGYAPLLRDSSCWTVVWATPASWANCLWVRPRRRRCAARPGSDMLLEFSIIRTPGCGHPSLTRCKGGLKRRTLKAVVGLAIRKHWYQPRRYPPQPSFLRRGREDLLLQGPSALTNKALNQVKSRCSHADPSRKKRRYASNP
jgi:hypothetical protein